MPSYIINFYCTRAGRREDGSIPMTFPRDIPSLKHAQDNGLPERIERITAEQGHLISDVVITDIRLA